MIRRCPSCQTDNRVPAARLKERARCARCHAALTPIDVPIGLHDSQAFDELITHSPLPVLVDFWAPWCAPCRVLAPELEKLARARAGSLVVAKLDTDEVPEVAGRFDISGVPSLYLFESGRVKRTTAGAMPMGAIIAELGL